MGSVRKLPSGKWRARYRADDGRERGQSFTRKTDADRWLATQQADVARGQWVDPALGRMTFRAWAAVWRAGLHGRRTSTLSRYDLIVRVHLVPRFGALPLTRVTAAAVAEMVADDVAAGYSASETRRHVIVLRQILTAAVRDGRIGRNVADDVETPTARPRPMRFLDGGQLARLADGIGGHYRPLVLTAGWVGLRWGELAGLALDRVDLLRHTVTVDRQLTEVDGVLAYGPPKTRAGTRVVTIPAGLTGVLGDHFASSACQDSGLAFPTVTAVRMRRSTFRRVWRRTVDRVFAGTDLSGLVFHELRHTAAALAIDCGAHPKVLQTRLGHSSITVTLDTYGHLFPSADEALAQALDGMFAQARVAQGRHRGGTVAHIRRSEA